jgi:uncharacterized membrane protein YraQ (UPF0718 family)
MIEYLLNFAALFTESAPWLLFGLLIAGFMKWLVPIELLQKHMGDNKLLSIFKAAFIGAPLPLCSCGVIPAAIGLRRSGASRSTTIAFLVATPETGVDSISVSYALLGPFFAIIRPFAAIFTAIYAGVMVKLFALQQSAPVAINQRDNLEKQANCCALEVKQVDIGTSCCENLEKDKELAKTSDDYCSSKIQSAHAQALPLEKQAVSSCSEKTTTAHLEKPEVKQLLINSLQFSSGKLLSDITKWLLIGLLLAAAIKTWVSTDFLLQWGNGFTAMLVMAMIGIPMYICATASTPLAAGFLAAGLSPGAILVFMLAGPATNIATMGMIRQEMGTSVLLAYLFSLFTASISIGYLANWLIQQFNFIIPTVAGQEHDMNHSIVYSLSAVLLSGLIIRNWIKAR